MIAKSINDLLGREITNKDYYNIKKIVIADNVENIYPDAFCRFRKLTSVVISNSVKKIETGAFRGCRHLASVELSESVQEIGFKAFPWCNALESIVVHKDNKTFDSRDNCNAIIRTGDNTLIVGCKNTVIPNGVKKIDSLAFQFGSEIEALRIPESLHFFSINTIRNRDGIMSIKVDKKNSIFDSRNNCNAIIRKNGNRLIYGCNNTTIPYGVEIIDYRAFEGCTGLTTLVIPDSVHTIGANAFYGCVHLATVTLSTSITSIGEGAFQDCGELKQIIIPGSVKCIYDKAFHGCINLTCLCISEGVKILCADAFSACCSLETVHLPQSIEKVYSSTFRYTRNLRNVIIPYGTMTKFEKLLPQLKDKLIEQ